MGRNLILYSQGNTSSQYILTSISTRISSTTKLKRKLSPFYVSNRRQFCHSTALLSSCSNRKDEIVDISKYAQVFSNRMSMAGLKPHHRIALGVSGGPDSMALCVLAAEWKKDNLNSNMKDSNNFIDGILAIIVDHGLRTESKNEANIVRSRVLNMGIRCVIASCDWLNGKPKQGHLQESARAARYQHFQKICKQHEMSALLVAHHGDDQAELFILRLSRKSGVLGLAGMAFTSQLFDTYPNFDYGASSSILLVRPLLEFYKDDMYKICQGRNQEWVEDPTNQSQLFVRNRIRRSLKNIPTPNFKPELETIISACRRTRAYVDLFCHSLINQAVTIMPQGYAVVDLDILNPLKLKDVCLSKFVTLLLQFISQRHKPVRGSALKLAMDYIRTYPCKTSFTAAGCYLCAAPGSKGTKVLMCCSVNSSFPLEISVNSSFPLEMQLFYTHSCEGQESCSTSEVEQIVADCKSYSDKMVLDEVDTPFLDETSSESVLTQAKRLGMLTESTHMTILSLQTDEIERFKSSAVMLPEYETETEVYSVTTSLVNVLHWNQIGYYMNRFLLLWKLVKIFPTNAYSVKKDGQGQGLVEEPQKFYCQCSLVNHDTVLEVRHMVDADWLYLAELCKCCNVKAFINQKISLGLETCKETGRAETCSEHVRLSAERALLSLKAIPVAARRGLPVLVHPQGLLFSIPSVDFKHCPCLDVSAKWQPRIPIGGGQCSYL